MDDTVNSEDEAAKSADGTHVAGAGCRAAYAMARKEWAAFIDRITGSIPDFPDVERPGPDSYETREEFD